MKSTIAMFGTLLVVALAGCASIPRIHDPSGVDVTVSALSEPQVMTYYGQGGPFEPDPYLPASSLLGGQEYDFIVLRIQLTSIRATTVTLLDATAMDSDGRVVARLFTRRALLELLQRQSMDDRIFNQLNLKVDQTYFHDRGVDLTPGRQAYAVVLAGRHPLPAPLEIQVKLDVGLSAFRTFELRSPE